MDTSPVTPARAEPDGANSIHVEPASLSPDWSKPAQGGAEPNGAEPSQPDFAGSTLDRLVSFFLSEGRFTLLAVTGIMIAAIAFADWAIGRDISLGVLYILPMMLAAVGLPVGGIVILATVCAILRRAFDSQVSEIEMALRFIFAWVSYVGSSLFVIALIRNRRFVVEHLAQIRREQLLRRVAEERLAALVDSSPAGILTLDHQGVVLAANRAASDLFEIPAGETLEHRTIRDYLPVLSDALDLAVRTEPFRTSVQSQGRRTNGEIFLAQTWFSTYVSPEGLRLAAILIDASEEMREREENSLQQLSQSIRITAAAVSHEMRNLCGAISMLYLNFKNSNGSFENSHLERMGNLVEGLERIASLELHSRVEDSLEPTSLRSVLDNLRIVIEPGWREIGGSIHWEIPPRISPVLGDPHGLLQAFLNLAQNSLRAVEQSAVRELVISVCENSPRATIRFCDSGPGVSAPERLFQPFQQDAQVAGMGLYVSRAILRGFGGELRYERPEHGACFAVDLQIVPAEVSLSAR
jgi:signal transduction histidine kinase